MHSYSKYLVSVCIHILRAVEFHIWGLIEKPIHPDMHKIQIIGFLFENRLLWQFEVRLLYLQYVPASKPFDHT